MPLLSLPISFGEAADKLSILEIKRERIREPEKLAYIERGLVVISEILKPKVENAVSFPELFRELKEINRRLWNIEDDLREHERRQDFGAEFVGLARAVYLTNDERQRVKRHIDELFDSPIREEKSYVDYGQRRPGA